MPHITTSWQRHKTPRVVISLILQALFLAACASPATPSLTLPAPKVAIITAIPSSTATASPTFTQTSTPTDTPTASATFTSTATPTNTPEPPTHTPWPTLAPTFTFTPEPTAITVLAGNYPQSGRCVGYHVGGKKGEVEDGFPGSYEAMQIIWCVTSVVVEDGTGNMLFLISWQGDNSRGLVQWHRRGSAYNHNLFLVDNLGNRYDHIATNDAVRDGGAFPLGKITTHTGSFTFPPAQPGAYSFIFVDLDQQLSIVDILLTTPALPTPAP